MTIDNGELFPSRGTIAKTSFALYVPVPCSLDEPEISRVHPKTAPFERKTTDEFCIPKERMSLIVHQLKNSANN